MIVKLANNVWILWKYSTLWHCGVPGALTWSPEEPAFGSMVRPRVTPPLRAFFRLSFTSVISSSRLTRSSSFCLQSSSTFFSLSDSEACERLPSGKKQGGVNVYHFSELVADRMLRLEILPAAASTAVRRSLLSFFSWVRWFLISCFFFISSSSLHCSRLASASTRFLPYLHCSASVKKVDTMYDE